MSVVEMTVLIPRTCMLGTGLRSGLLCMFLAADVQEYERQILMETQMWPVLSFHWQ